MKFLSNRRPVKIDRETRFHCPLIFFIHVHTRTQRPLNPLYINILKKPTTGGFLLRFSITSSGILSFSLFFEILIKKKIKKLEKLLIENQSGEKEESIWSKEKVRKALSHYEVSDYVICSEFIDVTLDVN